MEALDRVLDGELKRLLLQSIGETGNSTATLDPDALVARARSVLERIFLERGEVFASAVARSTGILVPYEDIEAVVFRDFETGRARTRLNLTT